MFRITSNFLESTLCIVPYREIREQIIKHPETVECAKELQEGTKTAFMWQFRMTMPFQ